MDYCLQVGATLDVYESVQKQLLPTPTKSHYMFNLRDVSKVFQVSCRCSASIHSLLCSPVSGGNSNTFGCNAVKSML